MTFAERTLGLFGSVWNKIPLLIKNRLVVKHQLLIWKLRKKHKLLTRKISGQLLSGQRVTDKDKTILQLVDELIIHNVAIVFNRVLWYFIPTFCLTVLAVNFFRIREAPVVIDLTTTKVIWKVANAQAHSTETIDWNMFCNDKFIHYTKSTVLNPLENEHKNDTTERDVILYPCTTNSPVEINQLPLPDNCYMGIAFSDSIQAEIDYQWRDTVIAPPTIEWELAFKEKKLKYGDVFLLNTCSDSRVIDLSKRLQRGQEYTMPIQGIHPWTLHRPIRVSEVSFNSAPLDQPMSRSAILSGKIRILNISDSAIIVQEGDRVQLKFKEPVDLYLSIKNGSINVRANGIVTKLECGPKVLGNNINKMPMYLKTVTDESPYLLTLIGIVVPLLIAMLIRQRKSI